MSVNISNITVGMCNPYTEDAEFHEGVHIVFNISIKSANEFIESALKLGTPEGLHEAYRMSLQLKAYAAQAIEARKQELQAQAS